MSKVNPIEITDLFESVSIEEACLACSYVSFMDHIDLETSFSGLDLDDLNQDIVCLISDSLESMFIKYPDQHKEISELVFKSMGLLPSIDG